MSGGGGGGGGGVGRGRGIKGDNGDSACNCRTDGRREIKRPVMNESEIVPHQKVHLTALYRYVSTE
jgi:hypothetical protein